MLVTTPLGPRNNEIVGRKAGTYKIDRLIGEGGMGAVYRGYCELSGQWGAIKVMHPEYASNTEVVQRFFREATTAGAVRDVNVLHIYGADYFAEDGRPFIVMPFIEGGSLEDLCKHGPMTVDKMVPIILQVCSGLDAVHAIGVIHRDVKTQNILVTRTYGREHHVFIVDFGIAKVLASYMKGDRASLTRTRAALGTPGCMAPEQARGEPDVDARADVYSVGMATYRMLTGRLPYEAPNMFTMLEMQARRAPYPRPIELRPDLPRIVDDLIMACLEFDKRQRPDSMFAVANILKGLGPAAEKQYEVLASTLAARHNAAAPEARTIAGGIETAIARSAIDTQTSMRKKSTMRVVAPFVVGVAFGAGVMALVKLGASGGDRQPTAAVQQPMDARSSTTANVSAAIVADAAIPPADAATVVATAPADAGVDASAAVAVAIPRIDAGTTALVRPVTHTQAPVTGTGTLVVKKPASVFLQVYIDDKKVCETPCRRTLDAGSYRLRLEGGGKDETTTVKINPGRETTIQRNDW